MLLGTSAGSAVVAQIGSGLSLAELFARQVDEASAEIDPGVGIDGIAELFLAAMSDPDATLAQQRQRIGAVALAADTVAEPVRRKVIAQRLPSHVWPERALRVTAIDVATGELVVFDRDSGVDAGRRGGRQLRGARSVAAGDDRRIGATWTAVSAARSTFTSPHDCAEAVVLVPAGESAPSAFGGRGSRRTRRSFGGAVLGVFADEESLAAFGPNPLDPSCRPPCARAGRAQGRRVAAAVAAFLGVR